VAIVRQHRNLTDLIDPVRSRLAIVRLAPLHNEDANPGDRRALLIDDNCRIVL
jgi:hypothetical protein